MALLDWDADPGQYDPSGGFQALPGGIYKVVFVSTAIKPNKDNTGDYIQLNMQVTEGEFDNAGLIDRLNYKHPNAQTVEIARNQYLGALQACGIDEVTNDTDVLLDCHCCCKVELVPPRTDPATGRVYEASNNVKKYYPLDQYDQLKAAHDQVAAQTAPPPPRAASGGFGARAAAGAGKAPPPAGGTKPAANAAAAAGGAPAAAAGGRAKPWGGKRGEPAEAA